MMCIASVQKWSAALAMGVLNGFFEMFFEKYSLETLLSSNGRRFIDALWRQAVAEGSEELFTSAANNVADIIVMAEKSGYMKNVADYIEAGSSESEAMQKALLDMGIDIQTVSTAALRFLLAQV